MRTLLLLLCLLAGTTRTAFPVTIERAALGTVANPTACAITRAAASVKSTDSQVFFRFQARRVQAGDSLRVEWIGPDGTVASTAAYADLPAAPDLCFLTALQIGGFGPASMPGAWQVRVVAGERVAVARSFRITGEADPGGLRVDSAEQTAEGEVSVRGRGFAGESVVHIARYKPEGGWSYIAALLPDAVNENSMVVRTPPLPPAEYLIILKNPDGSQSPPARLLIATADGYRLPLVGGARAEVTQGPYGSFSHYGNSLHAYDIAAKPGACVVAMRAGTVFPFDLHLKQTPSRRIFGNYITIQQDDGDYSHYAHLATGTFLVRPGQHVEQGQPLARIGNSGYTLGEGGGYHVHVHVTRSFSISSGSIPFRFDELPLTPRRTFRGVLVSSNRSGPDTCGPSAPADDTYDKVAVAEWWNRTVVVPRSSSKLEVRLGWEGDPRALNLYVVSPSGREYGAYGEPTGYSGQNTQPETLSLEDPEPGAWRVSVHGVEGDGPAIDFSLSTSVTPVAGNIRAGGR